MGRVLKVGAAGLLGVVFFLGGAPLRADLEMGTEDRDLDLNVTKSRQTRVEGGDFDDKLERISLDVTVKNRSLRDPKEGLTAKYWILGRSMVHDDTLQVLDLGEMKIDLGNEFGEREFQKATPEVIVKWDDTNAVHGARYDGFLFVILDSNGKVIKTDVSKNTYEKVLTKADSLRKDAYVGRDFKPVAIE